MSTATQPISQPRARAEVIQLPAPRTRGATGAGLRDLAELIKARVTTLIVLTAWTGFYFAAVKSGVDSFSLLLVHALVGIGMVAAGTAALNEAIERDIDALMHRTAVRPLVTGTMSLQRGILIGVGLTIGGAAYLAFACNLLTGLLALATSIAYLAAYTPLKRVHPLCTFVGAFPGAMPPVLGWAAVRGRVDFEAFVLFAIVFFWQFPHFHSIAWLYREDYSRANIRMLPVVESDGRSTVRAILLYLVALIPASTVPSLVGMSGRVYLVGAVILGLLFLWTGIRLGRAAMSPDNKDSKPLARRVLLASVLYLPLLFALMMINSTR